MPARQLFETGAQEADQLEALAALLVRLLKLEKRGQHLAARRGIGLDEADGACERTAITGQDAGCEVCGGRNH